MTCLVMNANLGKYEKQLPTFKKKMFGDWGWSEHKIVYN